MELSILQGFLSELGLSRDNNPEKIKKPNAKSNFVSRHYLRIFCISFIEFSLWTKYFLSFDIASIVIKNFMDREIDRNSENQQTLTDRQEMERNKTVK